MSQLEQVQSTDMIPRVDADAVPKPQIRLERHTPAYWRVTLDNPPFNIFGPKTIPELNAVITAIENDPMVKVVVFDSAVPGFFLTHYDFVAEMAETTGVAPGPTGMHPLPDMLVRLSRAPVVSIVLIRGRATGVGSLGGGRCLRARAPRPLLRRLHRPGRGAPQHVGRRP